MSISGVTGGAQIAADAYLRLGDVLFSDMEVPDKIPFGGEQRLSVRKLLGGARVIDAMGPDDQSLRWSGRFRGSLALSRATYLDVARRAGMELPLTWSIFNYTVVIQSFVAEYERDWEISYRISCEVVRDNCHPSQSQQPPTLDGMVNTDLFASIAYAKAIPPGVYGSQIQSVVGGVATLQQAIGSAGSLGGNASGLASVAGALSSAQTATSIATATIDAELSGVATIGGLVAGAPAASNASALPASGTLLLQSANLHQLGAYLNRMSINIAGANNQ